MVAGSSRIRATGRLDCPSWTSGCDCRLVQRSHWASRSPHPAATPGGVRQAGVGERPERRAASRRARAHASDTGLATPCEPCARPQHDLGDLRAWPRPACWSLGRPPSVRTWRASAFVLLLGRDLADRPAGRRALAPPRSRSCGGRSSGCLRGRPAAWSRLTRTARAKACAGTAAEAGRPAAGPAGPSHAAEGLFRPLPTFRPLIDRYGGHGMPPERGSAAARVRGSRALARSRAETAPNAP